LGFKKKFKGPPNEGVLEVKRQTFSDKDVDVDVLNMGFLDRIVVRVNHKENDIIWHVRKQKHGYTSSIRSLFTSDHLPVTKRIFFRRKAKSALSRFKNSVTKGANAASDTLTKPFGRLGK
jgi:hypothetical protein